MRRLFTYSRKTKESEDSDASSNDEAGSLKSSSGGEWDEKSSGSSDNELQAPRKEVGEYRLFYAWDDVGKIKTPTKFSSTRGIYDVPQVANL